LFWCPRKDKSSSMPSASLILALFVLLVLPSPGPRLFSSRPRLTSKKSLLYFPYSVFKEPAERVRQTRQKLAGLPDTSRGGE
jgi:hypothetical protein